jgi:peptide/nickel transport system substrate-binding protein
MSRAKASPLPYLWFALALAGVCGLVVPAPASTETIKYGGTLVVAATGEPNSLDPTLGTGGAARTVIDAMCERLYEYAYNRGKLELEPVLAAAQPTLSTDKLSYTIQLRQGIEFNDGTPFNAQAVLTTYQRYVTYAGSIWANDFAAVDSATAAGPYTVVFHLKQRNSAFLGNMYVLSPSALASEGAAFASDPICVSPFMFDHRVVGDNVTLVKSPYYYKRGAVFVDKIVFKQIPDPTAEVAALQAGDIQATTVDPTLVPTVEQSRNLRVVTAAQFNYAAVRINIGNRNGVGNLPYANVGTPLAQSSKLRQAFEEAIDRNLLSKVVWGGLYPPSCTPIPAADTLWYAATRVPCTPYDPADARKLVAASGFANPTVHLLATSTTSRLAQFIQAEEAQVGIDVVIDSTDMATNQSFTLGGHFDTALVTSASDPDPNTLLYNALDTNGATNAPGYSNPRLDYVLAHALEASSFKARAVDYRVAQQIIHDDRPIIVLYSRPLFLAFNSSLLSGIALTATGSPSLVNAQYK